MAERFKPNYPKTKFDWCIGRDVPVKIYLEGLPESRPGTVTVLDSNKNAGIKGLLLDGAVLGNAFDQGISIEQVVTDKGKDVTKRVMAFSLGASSKQAFSR